MAFNWNSGALMGQSVRLENGLWVRVRLARCSDVRAIGELLAHQPQAVEDVDPQQLVQFDPRLRYVVCATGLIDGSERLIGVGAIGLRGEEGAEPDVLVVDRELGEGLARAMWRILVDAAQASTRARAA